MPASETEPPKAVQQRLKRSREGQPLYPRGSFSTHSSNSSTRQVHPLDLEGLLDSLEARLGRFPRARQFSPRTRVAWMREDIKLGLLG